MKRYLLIIIIILCIFCSNIMVFAQENESEAYDVKKQVVYYRELFKVPNF